MLAGYYTLALSITLLALSWLHVRVMDGLVPRQDWHGVERNWWEIATSYRGHFEGPIYREWYRTWELSSFILLFLVLGILLKAWVWRLPLVGCVYACGIALFVERWHAAEFRESLLVVFHNGCGCLVWPMLCAWAMASSRNVPLERLTGSEPVH